MADTKKLEVGDIIIGKGSYGRFVKCTIKRVTATRAFAGNYAFTREYKNNYISEYPHNSDYNATRFAPATPTEEVFVMNILGMSGANENSEKKAYGKNISISMTRK